MTARKAPLRAVGASERPAGKRPGGVRSAAESGDMRELLVALRARIAADVENPNTPARDLAALSRRLLEIAREIKAIDSRGEGDEVGNAADTPDEEWAAT